MYIPLYTHETHHIDTTTLHTLDIHPRAACACASSSPFAAAAAWRLAFGSGRRLGAATSPSLFRAATAATRRRRQSRAAAQQQHVGETARERARDSSVAVGSLAAISSRRPRARVCLCVSVSLCVSSSHHPRERARARRERPRTRRLCAAEEPRHIRRRGGGHGRSALSPRGAMRGAPSAPTAAAAPAGGREVVHEEVVVTGAWRKRRQGRGRVSKSGTFLGLATARLIPEVAAALPEARRGSR